MFKQIQCIVIIFSYLSTRCYVQEILACLILLSEESWHQRLNLLFEVFKCSGNNGSGEMNYDDVVMTAQVIAMALQRLWAANSRASESSTNKKVWDQENWSRLTEGLADGAYAKARFRRCFSCFYLFDLR